MSRTARSIRDLLSHLVKQIAVTTRAMAETDQAIIQSAGTSPTPKLTGRAFYESIGRPKYIVAPMVDRSEFAWRMLTRSYMSKDESKQLLAYSPMLHARLFGEQVRVRDEHFQPTRSSLTKKEKVSSEARWLDGNPKIDRPLFVQFCANQPDALLEAAKYVEPYCDAVDLNLGCPQGIARNGRYGAFLQEDWDTIYKLINGLHNGLSIPVTAKMRILDTKEKTLEYAKMILSAGASIITVHGRRREQKGHNTGLADWEYIRYLRDNLPAETVIFANGNILNSGDLETCLEVTGADGIMSAEGNLSDPTIFAKPPSNPTEREYWTGPDGKGGYRIDGVIRRYLDIIYRYVLEREPPTRSPLFVASDPVQESTIAEITSDHEDEPPRKKQKQKQHKTLRISPNLRFMQGHFFQLLRPLLSIHTDIRDTLSRTRVGDMAGFEKVLHLVEEKTKTALLEESKQENIKLTNEKAEEDARELTGSAKTIAEYKRPWFVCQPHIRPLPEEAIKLGAMTVSKNQKLKSETDRKVEATLGDIRRDDENVNERAQPQHVTITEAEQRLSDEIPKSATVCG